MLNIHIRFLRRLGSTENWWEFKCWWIVITSFLFTRVPSSRVLKKFFCGHDNVAHVCIEWPFGRLRRLVPRPFEHKRAWAMTQFGSAYGQIKCPNRRSNFLTCWAMRLSQCMEMSIPLSPHRDAYFWKPRTFCWKWCSGRDLWAQSSSICLFSLFDTCSTTSPRGSGFLQLSKWKKN